MPSPFKDILNSVGKHEKKEKSIIELLGLLF